MSNYPLYFYERYYSMHLIIQDPATGKIRLTQTAIERYDERFARAGYNARQITTQQQFQAGVDASFALEMQHLASTARGTNPELDNALAGLPGWD